jgi:gas vesicle protein
MKESTMNKDNCIGFGVGLLAGAVAGGVFALLYAPKSGKETRHLMKDKATEFVDTLKDETSEVIDNVKEAASEANRKGKAVAHAIKN